jgi:hypothetical protein
VNKPIADDTPVHSYVITLCSAGLPMPLEVPFLHELVSFSVFRSRAIEDGRERFRLHVGYFESQARAIEALAVVRRHYPAAWISTPPGGDQSSLDDTMNTSFRVIKSAHARVASSTDARGAVADAASAPSLDQHIEPYSQRYVIQLDWTSVPIIVGAVPRLPAFRPYYLYTVRTLREGHPQYGLRLGFFKNFRLAQQVAEASRSHYPRLTVLPISHREFYRAVDLVQKRALKALSQNQSRQSTQTSRITTSRANPLPPR